MPENEPARLSKPRNVATWIVTGLLSLFFLSAGVAKLMGQPMHIDNFRGWGYPDGFVYVIGALETLSALLLLHPRTAPYGAGALVVDMAGATATHLRWAEWAMAPVRLVLLALAFFVGWMRRPEWFRAWWVKRRATAPAA